MAPQSWGSGALLLIVPESELDPLRAEEIMKMRWWLDRTLAPSTRATYKKQWAMWEAWAKAEGVTAFPASTWHVCRFAMRRLDQVGTVSALDQLRAAVNWVHGVNDVPLPLSGKLAQALAKATRKELGGRVKQAAILSEIQLKQLICWGLQVAVEPHEVLVAAAVALGTAAFLRFDELKRLRWDDISTDDQKAMVFIKRSKTDTGARGVTLMVARAAEHEVCAVALVERARELQYGGASGWFLKAIKKSAVVHGKTESILVGCRYMTNNEFNYWLRWVLVQSQAVSSETEVKLFSSHSMRRSGASLAINAGVAACDMRRHGRWSSEAAAHRYVECSEAKQLQVTQSFL